MDLRVGNPAPVQQSRVTCGATVLTVARALVDPDFDRWLTGDPDTEASLPAAHTSLARLAAYEPIVHRRTTALTGPAGLQIPWPRLLGTPPWGARAEFESGAAAPGVRYRVRLLRPLSSRRLGAAYDRLRYAVRPGAPAALYVGSSALPRHVGLVITSGTDLLAYDPGFGRVSVLTPEALTEHQLGIGGWNVPWFVVEPDP